MKKLLFIFLSMLLSISSFAYDFSYKGKKISVSDKLIEQRFKNIVHMYGDYMDEEDLKLMTFNQLVQNHLFISQMKVTATKQEIETYYKNQWQEYSPDNEQDFIEYLQSYGGYETKDIILADMEYRLKLQKASESFEKNYPDKDDNEYISNLTEDIKFAENSKYTIYNEKSDWVPYSEVLDRRIGYIDKVYETYVTDYNPNAEDKEKIHEKFENYKKGMRFLLMGLEEETYMGVKSISVNRDLDFIDAVFNLLYE